MNQNEPNATEEALSTPDHPVTRTTDEVRSGETPHIVRYVLVISMVLTIVAMGIAAAFYLGGSEAPPAPVEAQR
jgi:hypothetical protein